MTKFDLPHRPVPTSGWGYALLTQRLRRYVKAPHVCLHGGCYVSRTTGPGGEGVGSARLGLFPHGPVVEGPRLAFVGGVVDAGDRSGPIALQAVSKQREHAWIPGGHHLPGDAASGLRCVSLQDYHACLLIPRL